MEKFCNIGDFSRKSINVRCDEGLREIAKWIKQRNVKSESLGSNLPHSTTAATLLIKALCEIDKEMKVQESEEDDEMVELISNINQDLKRVFDKLFFFVYGHEGFKEIYPDDGRDCDTVLLNLFGM